MGAPDILALSLPRTYDLLRKKKIKFNIKSSRHHRRDSNKQYKDMGQRNE